MYFHTVLYYRQVSCGGGANIHDVKGVGRETFFLCVMFLSFSVIVLSYVQLMSRIRRKINTGKLSFSTHHLPPFIILNSVRNLYNGNIEI